MVSPRAALAEKNQAENGELDVVQDDLAFGELIGWWSCKCVQMDASGGQ
jgi:hypothetical protein